MYFRLYHSIFDRLSHDIIDIIYNGSYSCASMEINVYEAVSSSIYWNDKFTLDPCRGMSISSMSRMSNDAFFGIMRPHRYAASHNVESVVMRMTIQREDEWTVTKFPTARSIPTSPETMNSWMPPIQMFYDGKCSALICHFDRPSGMRLHCMK